MFKAFILSCSLFLIAEYGAFTAVSPNEALEMLIAGNKRYADGKSTHKQWEKEARQAKSESQSPFAIILGCSDSRSPPELIFDQGLGDLFVVRVAGNVVGDIEMASIEFAVSHLHSPLIMVLGHQDCGAIKTALKGPSSQEQLHEIYPLIDAALSQCKQEETDPVINATYCNIRQSVQTLRSASALAPFFDKKKLKIVGGFYDFHTGKVKLISESPAQPTRQTAAALPD